MEQDCVQKEKNLPRVYNKFMELNVTIIYSVWIICIGNLSITVDNSLGVAALRLDFRLVLTIPHRWHFNRLKKHHSS